MIELFAQLLAGVVLASSLGSAPPVGAEEHCVVEVIGESEGGELVTTKPVCFGTFSDAMAHASEGELLLPRRTEGDIVFSSDAVAQAVSSFTIGIHYDGYSGGGSSMTISGSSCSGGYWNATGSWANRIKSSYNGCPKLVHYDLPNLGGISQTTYTAGQIDNLSTLAGRVESIRYLP